MECCKNILGVEKVKHTAKLAYHVIRGRLKKKPYKLNFTVTSFCNSKCTTCNIWKNPNRTREELTLQEIETIFKKLPDTICWLSLTGGETFSRKDFPDIIKSAMTHIPHLALIGIPSNGLYQARMLEALQEISQIPNHPNIILSFSIDGPETLHDEIRGVPGGFRRTWDTYQKAKELTKNDPAITIAIETTISRRNVDVIYPFLENLLQEKHVVTLTFAHEAYLYVNEKGTDAKGIIPTNIAEIQRLIALFEKRFRFWHPKDIIEKRYLQQIPAYLRNPKKKPSPCMSLITTISLDAFGKVNPCLMWGKQLGDLRKENYSIMPIYNSHLSSQTRKDIKEDKCPNCWTPCEAYQSVLWDLFP